MSCLDFVKDDDARCILFQSSSSTAVQYMEDKVCDIYKADSISKFKVKSLTDLRRVEDVTVALPMFSERWVLIVDISKLGAKGYKDLCRFIKESYACIFLCISDKYRDFKEFKDLYVKTCTDKGFYSIYMTYMRYMDIEAVYEDIVPENMRMENKLFADFKMGYSNEVEEIFNLFFQMREGYRVSSVEDIVKVCGTGGNTVDKWVLSLLAKPPATEKGTNRVLKTRVQKMIELTKSYTWEQVWGYSYSMVCSLCDLKMLILAGDIYKKLESVPEGYDEKKLNKYKRYILSLRTDIPFSRLLRLRKYLNKKWYRVEDFVNFLYHYYRDYIGAEVVNTKNTISDTSVKNEENV